MEKRKSKRKRRAGDVVILLARRFVWVGIQEFGHTKEMDSTGEQEGGKHKKFTGKTHDGRKFWNWEGTLVLLLLLLLLAARGYQKGGLTPPSDDCYLIGRKKIGSAKRLHCYCVGLLVSTQLFIGTLTGVKITRSNSIKTYH